MRGTPTDPLAGALAEVRQHAEREARMAEDNSEQFAESGNETMKASEAAAARAYRHIVRYLDQLNPNTGRIDESGPLIDQVRRLCASPFDVLEIEYDDGVFTNTPVVRVADVIAVLDGLDDNVRQS